MEVLIVTLTYDYEGSDVVDVFDDTHENVRIWVTENYQDGHWIDNDRYDLPSGGHVYISKWTVRKI